MSWIVKKTGWTQELGRELSRMPYQEFLATPYWKTLTGILNRKKSCQRCRGTDWLEIRHRTREHQGFEVLHMKDLEVMCHNCHKLTQRGQSKSTGFSSIITA